MEWYVLFVKSSKEEEVQKWLDFHFDMETLRSLIPKRRLAQKKAGKSFSIIKPLFPGYVFVCTSMDLNKYKIIKGIPELMRILNYGTYYSSIENDEMATILKLVGCDSVIDYSKVFIENSRAIVIDGPLYGMESIIKKINKHTNRAKVQLNFMGELRYLDVGVEILYKID